MKPKTTEPRYIGTNWDDVKVAVTRRGDSLARKVVTKGVRYIDIGDCVRRLIADLRRGYEVRLTDPSRTDAIRIYPCAAKHGNGMDVTIRAMNELSRALADKTVQLIDPETRRRDDPDACPDEPDNAPEGITPDTTVTCPSCGHTIRVGRKLK